MAGKIELKAPLDGVLSIEPEDTASNFTVTLPATAATLLTDSAGVLNIGSGQIYKDASGNVGIGTSTPDALFNVHQSATSGTDSFIGSFTTQNGGLFRIACSDLSQANPVWQIRTGSSEPIAFNQASDERARFDSSGKFLVGTTSPRVDAKFEVVTATGFISEFTNTRGSPFGNRIRYPNAAPNGASNSFILGEDSEGEEFRISSAGAFIQASDRRIKSNINNATDALPVVANILVREYDKGFENPNHWTYGFIAQELHEVYPEVVNKPEKEEDMWGIEYSRLVPLLTKAIQELSAKVDAQAAEIEALKGEPL